MSPKLTKFFHQCDNIPGYLSKTNVQTIENYEITIDWIL